LLAGGSHRFRRLDQGEQPGERFGFMNTEPLDVIDAKFFQRGGDFLALDKFGDGADPHDVSDPVDGIDNGSAERIRENVFDEMPVDLDVVHLEIAEISE
jgi:hypothetical protein